MTPVANTAKTKEQLASAVAIRKCKRLAVVVLRLCKRIQRRGPVAGFTQRHLRRSCERSDILPRRPRKLECAEIVVRHHLRVIFRATERLDPLGSEPVLFDSLRARDLAVRHVPNEQMLESELRLARHGWTACALHELFALERM